MKLTLTLLSKVADIFEPAGFKPSFATSFATQLIAVGVLSTLTACSASKWHETQGTPNTGDPIAERQVAPTQAPLRAGQPAFVTPDRLPAPAKHEVKHTARPLERNDEIVVTDPNPKGDHDNVEAVVTNTKVPDLKGKKVLLPKKYISAQPAVPTNEENERDKYFVIQNIATEKLRVYRNCASKSSEGECVHKLVLETDMAAGQDTKRGRSLLGSYRISNWFKFYEDDDHYYPSFISPKYPELPKADEKLSAWLSKSLLPKGKGISRGSFGWYTAKLEPNADNQWTHGTLGWGADGGRFINEAKNPANAPAFTRSQGCTRVENQVIALLREMLPVGSRMFKIYAKEDYKDSKRTRYQTDGRAMWSWVLTNTGTMSMTEKSGAKDLVSNHSAEILDRGSYAIDQFPTAVKREENLYHVPASSMKGVLLVDEGRLEGYSHPKELGVGGFEDHKLPSIVLAPEAKPDIKAEVKAVAKTNAK